jgi:hypothetical protein
MIAVDSSARYMPPAVPGLAPAREELRWFLSHCRAPKIRSRRQFAEDEIILPEGPYKGRRFKAARQPFTSLWLDAVDQGRWQRVVTTGPSQSGKTLVATLIPLLYHLFEIGETVGFALPDMDMADDKWRKDILPTIERTRFRELLPIAGEGARAGKVKNMVVFRNGAALKFFSGGGGDKSRAGFTCRVLIITEANAFGGSAETSDEASKLEQLFARLRSFGSSALAYLECTVEIETDVIWSAYKSGSESRIACPCPHCGAFVSPEREHLRGWQEAADAEAARSAGHFFCPSCEAALDDEPRAEMNRRAVLLHRGQIVEDKTVRGDAPQTRTLGFRWSAFHNLFASAADLAQDEWEAARAADEDSAERKMCQFVWCLPYKGQGDEGQILQANLLTTRLGKTGRGIIPAGTIAVTVGCDMGKRLAHFDVKAFAPDGSPHLADYGRFEIASDDLGEERAILAALRQFRDEIILPGFPIENSSDRWVPDQVWIDARWQGGKEGSDAVYAFIRECDTRDDSRDRFRPTFGYGSGLFRAERYARPRAVSKTITAIGEGYHFVRDLAAHVLRVEIDVDYWKGWFHTRLSMPVLREDGTRNPGALTLYKVPMPKEHTSIAKHWTAERLVREYVAGKGEVVRFVRLSRNNHWLDAGGLGSAAAHFCGVRIIAPTPKPAAPPPASEPLTTPDGRPYFIRER